MVVSHAEPAENIKSPTCHEESTKLSPPMDAAETKLAPSSKASIESFSRKVGRIRNAVMMPPTPYAPICKPNSNASAPRFLSTSGSNAIGAIPQKTNQPLRMSTA